MSVCLQLLGYCLWNAETLAIFTGMICVLCMLWQAESEAADFSEQDVDLEAYDSGSDEEAKSPGRWGASSREFTSMQLKQDHINRC